MVLVVAFVALVALAVVAEACKLDKPDTPNLWTDLTFEQAKEKATEENRILLAYATASWCPPCKHMERTTWADPKVAEWFKEHGIAFKFDVDENPQLSRSLGVRAMPTLFAYREGEVFDRLTGARTTEQLIGWLENVKEGRSEMDALRERAGQRMDAEGKVDVQDRLNIARMLTDAGDFGEATDEYLWLWDNMLDHEPAMVGVRGSFMISEIGRLAQRYPPAKEAFSQRRAKYLAEIRAGTANGEVARDWITLAEPVGEAESVLEWFNEAKEDPKQRQLLPYAEHLLRDRLIVADRWHDVALLYPNPVAHARNQVQTLRMDDVELEDRHRTSMLRLIRRSVSIIYASLLAVGDEKGAADVAGMLLDVDDSPDARQALASIGLQAGQPRLIHLQWLDEALEMGAHVRQLRREVAEALADSHT